MKRHLLLLMVLLTLCLGATAQEPLYIVNGAECRDIKRIPPEEIEHMQTLPADEETIARYGERAANGVILISLRYDTPARFEAAESFSDYIADQVHWDETDPAARVVVRYRVTPEGEALPEQTLESTDSRLKRRVLKALACAPRWRPATKNGAPVASTGILRIQLPKGRRMPRQAELIIR